MKWFRWAILGALTASSSACASKQVQPVMVSSAGASGYALVYPDRLRAEVELLQASRKQAAELPPSIATRARDFKPIADPQLYVLIVQRADESGRSEAYDAAYEEALGLNRFWEEERGPITARVNGAAQKHIAEAGCTQQTELGGPISYALKDGIERQLEKRLRACNEAQRMIERQKTALGTANAAAARQLADDVARSSYAVYVALPERLQHLVDERSDVESTLDGAIDLERRYQQSGVPAAEQKASQERLTALQTSRNAIAAPATAAEAALKDLDKQIEDARASHEAALERLEGGLQALQAPAQQQARR
jgi:hypothetical protein